MDKQVDSTYNEIKLGHQHRFVIYKLNDAMTEIVVQETAPPSQTYADFLAKMPKVRLNHAYVSYRQNDCRYGVVDFSYQESDGSDRSKLVFVVW